MKSGRSASATPDSGSRLAASASASVATMNHWLHRPQDLLRARRSRGADVRQRHHGFAPPRRLPLPNFFAGSCAAGSSGRGIAGRGAAQDEQVLAAVDSGERSARDAGEDLPGVALERRDARDREARRIGAVEPRRHEHVADLDVGGRRHESKLRAHGPRPRRRAPSARRCAEPAPAPRGPCP